MEKEITAEMLRLHIGELTAGEVLVARAGYRLGAAQYRQTLEYIMKVMGPVTPNCSGCRWEWDEVLSTVSEALNPINGGR